MLVQPKTQVQLTPSPQLLEIEWPIFGNKVSLLTNHHLILRSDANLLAQVSKFITADDNIDATLVNKLNYLGITLQTISHTIQDYPSSVQLKLLNLGDFKLFPFAQLFKLCNYDYLAKIKEGLKQLWPLVWTDDKLPLDGVLKFLVTNKHITLSSAILNTAFDPLPNSFRYANGESDKILEICLNESYNILEHVLLSVLYDTKVINVCVRAGQASEEYLKLCKILQPQLLSYPVVVTMDVTPKASVSDRELVIELVKVENNSRVTYSVIRNQVYRDLAIVDDPVVGIIDRDKDGLNYKALTKEAITSFISNCNAVEAANNSDTKEEIQSSFELSAPSLDGAAYFIPVNKLLYLLYKDKLLKLTMVDINKYLSGSRAFNGIYNFTTTKNKAERLLKSLCDSAIAITVDSINKDYTILSQLLPIEFNYVNDMSCWTSDLTTKLSNREYIANANITSKLKSLDCTPMSTIETVSSKILNTKFLSAHAHYDNYIAVSKELEFNTVTGSEVLEMLRNLIQLTLVSLISYSTTTDKKKLLETIHKSYPVSENLDTFMNNKSNVLNIVSLKDFADLSFVTLTEVTSIASASIKYLLSQTYMPTVYKNLVTNYHIIIDTPHIILQNRLI